MGANSQQGIALLVFFTSFTLASIGMLRDGNIVLLLLAVVTFVASDRAVSQSEATGGVEMTFVGLAVTFLGFVIAFISLGVTDSTGDADGAWCSRASWSA